MIDIKRKEDCCGCGACFDACAKKAIVWEPDYEGFFYPHVDTSKCVNCGLCNSVCPIENSDSVNEHNKGFTPIVIGCYHKDRDIQFTSTSGGAFWGLAEPWIERGGYVAGAIFTDDFKVKHIVTNTIDGLKQIKGSKYAQSDCRGMYKEITKLLKNGERVLATGLPCQMAALRQYLRKDYDNLLIVDLICHSVTSQFVFGQYIDYLEKEYKSKVIKYHPKNKEYGGWHDFAFKATFENGNIYVEKGTKDYFTEIFVGHDHILGRKTCYLCHYKHFPQPSDITIGDFWGIDKVDPQFDSPNGISKVIINNEKGKSYFETLDCFVCKEYDAKISVFDNIPSRSMIESLEPCNIEKRKRFVRDLHRKGFKFSVEKYLKPRRNLFKKVIYTIRKYVTTVIK